MAAPISLRLTALVLLPMTLLLAACVHGGVTQEQRLAAYSSYAGAPVKRVRYFNPIAWDAIDDEHVLLTMRPRDVYLMRLSGPCLGYGAGSPVLILSSTAGYVVSGFDRITMGGSGLTCRIEEIRPVDMARMRAGQAEAQPSAP